MDTGYITPAQAARRIGTYINHVYSLLWAGKLRGERTDQGRGRWKVSVLGVDAYLERRRRAENAKIK